MQIRNFTEIKVHKIIYYYEIVFGTIQPADKVGIPISLPGLPVLKHLS